MANLNTKEIDEDELREELNRVPCSFCGSMNYPDDIRPDSGRCLYCWDPDLDSGVESPGVVAAVEPERSHDPTPVPCSE